MSLPALALTLIRALPASPAVLLARLLVLTYLACRPSCRAEIRHNHRVVLGRDRAGFWVVNAWQTGLNLALMTRKDSATGQLLIDKAEVSGDNGCQRSLEQNLHMTMASFHFGTWEFLPGVFRHRGHRVALVVGIQRDRVLEGLLSAPRARDGVRLLRGAGELVEGGPPGLIGFMLDNTGRGRAVTARAAGVTMRIPGPAFRFARHQHGGVSPSFCVFERGRLRVRVYPPGDENHALGCLLAEVRRRPADWIFWGKAGALEAA